MVAAPGPIPLNSTMGPTLVGSFLSAVFYGVTLLQTYQYYERYARSDKLYVILLVTVLLGLDTFALVANLYSEYFYLIKNYGNYTSILHIDWSLTFSVMATAIVGFLVQTWYAYRVFILGSKRIFFPFCIIIFSVTSLSFALYYMSMLFRHGSLKYIPTVTWASTASLALSLTADTLITICVLFYLLQRRQRGIKQTEIIIHKLILLTVATGGVTVLVTVISLILGEVYRKTFYNTIFYFPLSKCYISSMLAFLNNRQSLRTDGVIHADPTDIKLTTVNFRSGTTLGASGALQHNASQGHAASEHTEDVNLDLKPEYK